MKTYPPSIRDLIPLGSNGGVFFIHTQERFIIKKLKDELRQFVAENPSFELVPYDMTDSKSVLFEAVNTAREIGFFCAQKIIILELGEKLSDKERDLLESYIDSSEPNNYLLVFITEIDKRTKFFKTIQKLEKIYHVVPPPGLADLKKFIKTEFEPFNPDERLIEFFLNAENQDMFYIHSEIEKLKLFASGRQMKTISFDHIDDVLNGLSEQVIFKIMDYLTDKKIVSAVKLFRETITVEGDYKVNPLVVSMFFKHFKALMKGRILLNEKKGSEFSTYLTKNRLFYLKNKSSQLAASYKNITILKALRKLANIEMGMKGARNIPVSDTTIELEQFMVEYF